MTGLKYGQLMESFAALLFLCLFFLVFSFSDYNSIMAEPRPKVITEHKEEVISSESKETIGVLLQGLEVLKISFGIFWLRSNSSMATQLLYAFGFCFKLHMHVW